MKRRQRTSLRPRLGLAALAAATALVVWGLAMPQDITALAYILLSACVAGIVLLCGRAWSLSAMRRRPDLWEPPTAYSILALAYVVLGFVAFLTNDSRFRVQALGQDNSRLVEAAALMAFGLAALWLGYRAAARTVPIGRIYATYLRRQFGKPNLAMTLVVYALVTSVHVWRLFSGSGTFDAPGLGVAEQTVDDVVSLGYFILALVALQAFLGRWPRFVLYLILAPEVFFASLTAFISAIVIVGIIVIGATYYTTPRLCVRWLVLFAVLVVIITPVTLSMRAQIRSGEAYFGSIGALAESAWRGLNDTWLAAPGDALIATYSKLIGRLGGNIQILGVVLDYVPARIPFLGTQDLVRAPLFVVPRFFWPDKPSPSLVGGFTSRVFLKEDNNAVTPTTFGDLYLHGGLGAIAMGMFLLGVLFNIQYRLSAPRAADEPSTVMLAWWLSLTYTVINPESAYGAMVQALLQKPFLMLFAAFLICSPGNVALRQLAHRLRPSSI
jgi:hypothetical protein